MYLLTYLLTLALYVQSVTGTDADGDSESVGRRREAGGATAARRGHAVHRQAGVELQFVLLAA